MHRHCAAGLILLSCFVTSAIADVTLPCVFSDHMVLQRDEPVAIWGWADEDEEITVSVAGESASTATNADGRWMLKIGPLTTGGPHTMTVQGTNTVTLEDVLVGEVWLCSGQSNMAMTVSRANDFEQEKEAANWPKIRMLTVARQAAEKPAAECEGEWQICSPETVGGFSATAYFFGRTLHKELGVPGGIL